MNTSTGHQQLSEASSPPPRVVIPRGLPGASGPGARPPGSDAVIRIRIRIRIRLLGRFAVDRRCALYLTYYRYGDTRKRGMAMVAFKAAYRAAGLEAAGNELPDYLPMVLDFAALHPRGQKLLRAHRADLELLLRALRDAPSPYADVIEAVSAQLPALRRPDRALVQRFWDSGPPEEEVGLEPFAPPGYLEASR